MQSAALDGHMFAGLPTLLIPRGGTPSKLFTFNRQALLTRIPWVSQLPPEAASGYSLHLFCLLLAQVILPGDAFHEKPILLAVNTTLEQLCGQLSL